MKKLLIAFLSLAMCTPVWAFPFRDNFSISFTPTLQTSAYSSGNSLGGLQTVNFFATPTQPGGKVDNFFVVSKGGATTAMTVYIFDTNPSASTCTDKSAISLNAADVSKLAVAPFTLTPAVVGTGTTDTFAQSVLS